MYVRVCVSGRSVGSCRRSSPAAPLSSARKFTSEELVSPPSSISACSVRHDLIMQMFASRFLGLYAAFLHRSNIRSKRMCHAARCIEHVVKSSACIGVHSVSILSLNTISHSACTAFDRLTLECLIACGRQTESFRAAVTGAQGQCADHTQEQEE